MSNGGCLPGRAGGTPDWISLSDTWTFDGSTWVEVDNNAGPASTDESITTVDGQLVGFGGYDVSNTTSIFNGTSWTVANVAGTSPITRELASMAPLGTLAVLFGGLNEDGSNMQFYNDTWTFNGSSWTSINTPNAPPARDRAGMAAFGNKAVLFGGLSGNGAETNDTWVFSGTTWTLVNTATSPSPRTDALLAPLGNQVVLFGGSNLNDTWLFNGTTWTKVMTTNAPPGAIPACMAALGTQAVVLFGGTLYAGDTAFGNATWMFDGTNWTELAPTVSPPARSFARMASLP